MPTHKANLTRLSIRSLAELTGFANETVSKRLREAGLTPVVRDGRTLIYETRPALRVLFATADPQAERARFDRARADAVELKNRQVRGELVPAADQDRAVIALATLTSSRLQGIPAAIAQELAATRKPAEAHAIVERAIHAALHELADAGQAAIERAARGEGSKGPVVA